MSLTPDKLAEARLTALEALDDAATINECDQAVEALLREIGLGDVADLWREQVTG